MALEVAAEVRRLGVAELRGDGLDRLAGGEVLGGGGHALALEPLARGMAEVALAEAFERAPGNAQQLRGDGGIPLRALGERAPEGLVAFLGGV